MSLPALSGACGDPAAELLQEPEGTPAKCTRRLHCDRLKPISGLQTRVMTPLTLLRRVSRSSRAPSRVRYSCRTESVYAGSIPAKRPSSTKWEDSQSIRPPAIATVQSDRLKPRGHPRCS